ncbi:outer membrane protein assembly factor BamD [Pendulispora rubella]|uniref:Outer membrane protein assembly factor BamD n=1 Tax=Pendulispora rubella TaxID=2741070 RepID=A0ABZ2LHP0_9BACT
MSNRQRFVLAGAFTVLFASAWTASARADDASKQARAEYDAGAAAYEKKEYTTAAQHFARADERVPNSRALQLAMAASLSSTDGVLAMELVERAETRAVDGALAELAQRLRKKFVGSAGKIRVVCPADVPCTATIDDNAERTVEGGRSVWVAPGKHIAHLRARNARSSGAKPVDREVAVAAGATADVTASSSELAPTASAGVATAGAVQTDPREVQPPPEIRPERRASGLAPVYFWTALGVTGAAVATATVFTVITKQRHDDFVSNPSQQTADDGSSAQTLARVAWGVTGAFAATTIVLAALTDFHPAEKRAAATKPLSVAVGPGSVLLVGQFQ